MPLLSNSMQFCPTFTSFTGQPVLVLYISISVNLVPSLERLKSVMPKLVPTAILPLGIWMTLVTKLSGKPSAILKLLKIVEEILSLLLTLSVLSSNFSLASLLSRLNPSSAANQRFPDLSSVMLQTRLSVRPWAVVKVVKDFPSYFDTPPPLVPNQRFPDLSSAMQ